MARERFPRGTIQTGDVQDKLKRRYNLHGKVSVANIADELFPVVIVDDLHGQQDWWQQPVAQGERRYWGYAIVAPVAAQFPVVILENSLGLGVVMRVEAISFLGGADVIRWGTCASFPGVPVGTFGLRDTRVLGGTAPYLIRQSTNVGSQITLILGESTGTGNPNPLDVDLVLNPGERFGIEKETVNTQLNAGIYFTVRGITA